MCTVTEDQTYTVSGAHSPRVLRVLLAAAKSCLPLSTALSSPHADLKSSPPAAPLWLWLTSVPEDPVPSAVPAPDHSHVPWIHVLKSFIVYRNSSNLSSLVCLALSMETRLEQAATLVMAMEAVPKPSHASLIADMEAVPESTL